jgi:hypothetical protein
VVPGRYFPLEGGYFEYPLLTGNCFERRAVPEHQNDVPGGYQDQLRERLLDRG